VCILTCTCACYHFQNTKWGHYICDGSLMTNRTDPHLICKNQWHVLLWYALCLNTATLQQSLYFLLFTQYFILFFLNLLKKVGLQIIWGEFLCKFKQAKGLYLYRILPCPPFDKKKTEPLLSTSWSPWPLSLFFVPLCVLQQFSLPAFARLFTICLSVLHIPHLGSQ